MISRENLLEQQLREKNIEIERLEDENEELQQRINKAVEHIENIKKYGVYMVNGNDLLDILKGSDKEC